MKWRACPTEDKQAKSDGKVKLKMEQTHGAEKIRWCQAESGRTGEESRFIKWERQPLPIARHEANFGFPQQEVPSMLLCTHSRSKHPSSAIIINSSWSDYSILSSLSPARYACPQGSFKHITHRHGHARNTPFPRDRQTLNARSRRPVLRQTDATV